MDKSLKKLNRMDLLEQLVWFATQHEALMAENANLRQSLEQQPPLEQRLSLSRNMKVGSIAELAMQNNEVFEAAQRAADDYLREIKQMRDQLAKRAHNADLSSDEEFYRAQEQARAQAREQADQIINNAQLEAQAIIQQADSIVDNMLSSAQAQSDEIIADANRQSHAILAQTQRQSSPRYGLGRPKSGQHAQDAQRAQRSRRGAVQKGKHARTAVVGGM